MLHFTDTAKTKIKELFQEKDSSTTGIRLQIKDGDQLEVSSVELMELESGEEPLRDPRTNFFVELEGFLTVVEPGQKEKFNGTQINYESGGLLSGQFKLVPVAVTSTGGKLDLQDPLVQEVRQVLDAEINPGLAMHGGFAELLNIEAGQVYLKFGGGCQGCSQIDATVKQGVETRLKEVFPQLTGVVDATDHDSGVNPYFK